MEIIGKAIFLIVVGLFVSAFAALISALFVYAGWNWGVVPAFAPARDITLFQAFWLSLALTTIGGALKSNITVNRD